MPTINQLIRKGREQRTSKSNSPILQKCPQKRKRKEKAIPLLNRSHNEEQVLFLINGLLKAMR